MHSYLKVCVDGVVSFSHPLEILSLPPIQVGQLTVTGKSMNMLSTGNSPGTVCKGNWSLCTLFNFFYPNNVYSNTV